jgi:uncharacterized membrane protein
MTEWGMIVHIGAGSTALTTGAVALIARKGSDWHARFGGAFVISMLLMAASGAGIAVLKPERVSAVTGVFTIYLVVSSWLTIRRKQAVAGRYEILGLIVAAGCAVADFSFGVQAAAHPSGRLDGFSGGPYFAFSALAALAAALDINFLARRRLTGSQRVARHLWRMCVALFIAASSFFLGQRDLFLEGLRQLPLLSAPPLITLGLMLYWLLRLRFPKLFPHAAKTVRHVAGAVVRRSRSAAKV